uniref:Uncharacterized protein n=1 Tax=Anguilla anguilla TaxID=7936 RepID=A0A0E9W1X1_ANGAN
MTSMTPELMAHEGVKTDNSFLEGKDRGLKK